MKNPIRPVYRDHNSKRLPYPTGKHPEINDPSYILSKNIPKTSPLRVGRGCYSKLLNYNIEKHTVIAPPTPKWRSVGIFFRKYI